MNNLKILHLRFRLFLRQMLSTAAVLYFVLCALTLIFACPFIFIWLFFTKFYFVPILYSIWFIYDFNTCDRGGRRWNWFRNLKMWTYFCEYFPVRMIKTCELPPTKNYLMCYHPHGFMCFGAFTCFATEATNFKKEFPGLTARLLTLWFQFGVPFHREQALGIGICSATKESIDWLLSKEGTGNACCLVVGGAIEILEAHEQTANLFLKKRKGFIKMALKHGASLVPVFAFGENDLFSQLPNPNGSRLRNLQNKLAELANSPVSLFFGRWGTMLPRNKPITVIIGKPIDLEKEVQPSQERIDEIHKRYVKELTDLFETHKLKYGPNVQLKIV